MSEEDLIFLLALHCVDGLGPIRLKAILDYFGSPKPAWQAQLTELSQLGLPRNALENFKNAKLSFDPESEYKRTLKSGIKICSIFDEDYPKLLAQIPDSPILLFCKGNMDNLQKCIAVVGTRKVTGYGKTVTEKFVNELLGFNVIIVSGLARGVDTIAHSITVTENGRTIAVLGGGLNNIFPSENTRLSQEIVENGGAVISEFAPDSASKPGNFPSRNRIIAGLSLATLVTEAAEDSGSLITAHLAAEYNREVFAVPGPITSNLSLGPASLISNGAKLVINASQIIDELKLERGLPKGVTIQDMNLNEDEKSILNLLAQEERHIDDLVRDLSKPSPLISACLLKMEIKGLVKNLGSGVYVKSI